MICFERVRALREVHEMTQKDIATILEVDKSTFAAWERGRDLFPLKRLNTLCNYYKVSLDYITGQTNKMKYIDQRDTMNPTIFKIRIKAVRKENQYTQENLAQYLNTTHSAISAYENGHLWMPLIFLFQFSKNFNVSMDWLLGKTENKYLESKKKEFV